MGFQFGGTIVLERSFTYPYQVIQKMVQEKVTGFPGVPTIFAILLGLKNLDRVDFSSLRCITNTAAALPPAHIRQLRSLFPHAKIYSMYGLTECKRVSYLPPEEVDRRPDSVGKGMSNEEVWIVDEAGNRVGAGVVGELVVRGSNVMRGYWGLPEEMIRKEGWLSLSVLPVERTPLLVHDGQDSDRIPLDPVKHAVIQEGFARRDLG